jgi:hypothetical protein
LTNTYPQTQQLIIVHKYHLYQRQATMCRHITIMRPSKAIGVPITNTKPAGSKKFEVCIQVIESVMTE